MILICWAFPKIITFWSNNFLDWLLTMNECVYCVLKNVYTQYVYAVCTVSIAANVCVRLASMCGVYARKRKSRAREKTQKKHSKWRRNIPLNGIVNFIWARSALVCLTDCDYGSLMREHFFHSRNSVKLHRFRWRATLLGQSQSRWFIAWFRMVHIIDRRSYSFSAEIHIEFRFEIRKYYCKLSEASRGPIAPSIVPFMSHFTKRQRMTGADLSVRSSSDFLCFGNAWLFIE